MSWPLISDFSRMLQNPQIAFRDLRLRESRIEMDRWGQPRPRSGNFATVYRANLPDGTALAVKVFNRRAEERRERYRVISDYLELHRPDAVVRFEYDERGIRSGSDGKLYPLLTMDWVEGATLFDWARERAGPRHGGPGPGGRRLARRDAGIGSRGNRPRRLAARQCHGFARGPDPAG